ncbi:hypothetical protein [Micromonospora chokoriensis]|nr:hypothetical protein [Micromonospora chokoriensis]
MRRELLQGTDEFAGRVERGDVDREPGRLISPSVAEPCLPAASGYERL